VSATADPLTGVWLYAICRDGTATQAPAGVDADPVRAVRHAGLAAVVSDVPLAEYGPEPLRRHLEDLRWLERTSRAHHGVVATLFRASTPVIPAPLATIYLGDDGVVALLDERAAEFAEVLDRVGGHVEWGVKGFAAPPAAPPAEAATGRTGTAYLLRRRAQLNADADRRQAAQRDAAEVHAALSGHSAAARRHRAQHRALSGADTTMVLNAAYLVDRAAQDAFRDLVERLADRHPGIRLELTGPWPPYSFVSAAPQPTERRP
jgi:Gas vesicle synthesis protein GvpL/GvpF